MEHTAHGDNSTTSVVYQIPKWWTQKSSDTSQ